MSSVLLQHGRGYEGERFLLVSFILGGMIRQARGKHRKVLQMRSSAMTGRTIPVKIVLLMYLPSKQLRERDTNF